MDERRQKQVLKVIIILSLLGLVTSLYLVKGHYSDPGSGTVCNFNDRISCNITDASKYSEFLGVPVAVFGAMWFIIMMSLAWKSLKKKGDMITFMLSWTILGTLFVIYLVVAEIILKTLCPFCTLAHIIIIISLVSVLLIYKAQEKVNRKSFMQVPKSWFKTILAINLILILLFNFFPTSQTERNQLKSCLEEKDIKMYSSFKCSVCIKSEEVMGDLMAYINRVECHPLGENSQYDLCVEEGVEGTPTWVLEENGQEVKRHVGFLSLEGLGNFAEC